MKKVLPFAAAAEFVTGLALLIVPSLFGRLLLGEELTGVAKWLAIIREKSLKELGRDPTVAL